MRKYTSTSRSCRESISSIHFYDSDQHQILGGIGKFHGGKLLDQLLIHFGLAEVKAEQVAMDRKLGGVDLVADRADATIIGFALWLARWQGTE